MRNTVSLVAAVFLTLVSLLACEPAPSLPSNDDEAANALHEEGDDGAAPAEPTPPTDDPSVEEDPVVSADISTDGCNGARWCGDLFGTQFVSNIELVNCGDSCSIHQTESNVEGCLLTLSGAVAVAMEGSYPDSYLAFGSVAVGSSVEHVVRVENQGNADCAITDVSVAAGVAASPFSIVDPAIDVLAPGAFVDVAIRFAPTSAQGLETSLFYLPGTATAWLTLVAVSVDADDTSCRLQVDAQHAAGINVSAYVGGGRSTGITVANVGAAGCLLLPFEVNGESFAAAPAIGPFDDPLAPEPDTAFVAYPSTLPLDVTDGVLAPGEHVALDVEFSAPLEEGTTSGTLIIRAQGAEDVALPLTGTAFPWPPPCDCEENWGSDCTFNPEC